MITEEKIYIGDIPCLKISCHEDVKGMVIFIMVGHRQKNCNLCAAIFWRRTAMMS